MANRTTRTGMILLVLVTAMSSCGQGRPPSANSASAPAGGASAASASAAQPPPVDPPAPSTVSPTGCLSGTYKVLVRLEAAAESICLYVGASVRLNAPASPQQPWQPPSTSNADVLTCTSIPEADGAASAVCNARRAGEAVVTTTTAPFAGDPHGPPQRQWQLTVRVRT